MAATAGSAVGLGNIWRLPYEAGVNGGGAFILVFILCIILLGIPVMLSEFIIGRSTHKTIKSALRQLSPKTKIYRFSHFVIIGVLITLGFYSVVCGWVIEYLYQAIVGGLSGHTSSEYTQIFNGFVGNGWQCVGWTIGFLAVNFLVMGQGVQKGIERISSIMMPLLFLFLVVFAVKALFMPGFKDGIEFFLYPDFSKLTMRGVIDAMGQAFMSLSLGAAAMIIYSSYFNDDAPLAKDATIIAGVNTLVGLLAGIIIFPAVFSFGFEPQSGPRLFFEVLPGVFQQMAGGQMWAIMFFTLVFFAALTSTISLSEVVISFFHEECHMSRNSSLALTAVLAIAVASVSAMAFNVLDHVTVFGMNLFDLFNTLSSNLFMLGGGIFTAVFVGWFLDRQIIIDQLSNHGRCNRGIINFTIFALRYIAPVAVIMIFLFSTGII